MFFLKNTKVIKGLLQFYSHGNSNEYLTKLKENIEVAIKTANTDSADSLAARMAELQQELINRTEK